MDIAGLFEVKGAVGKPSFFGFDTTKVNEEVCTQICSEMPKCTSLTFRSVAEEGKWGPTQAGQCRFKTGRTRENLFEQETRISFFKNEGGSYEKFIDQGIDQGEFLKFNSQNADKEACKKLCKDMPRCRWAELGFAAEGNTEAPQCRFITS